MGKAYIINKDCFRNNLGKVTLAESVPVMDFTLSAPASISNRVYIEISRTPFYADTFHWQFESLSPAVASIDADTGLLTPLDAGEATIRVTETLSGIVKELVVNIASSPFRFFHNYLVEGKRPEHSSNTDGKTYKLANDSGQAYTPADSVEIGEGYTQIKVSPFKWWMSSGRAYNTQALIFLGSNKSTIVKSYDYEDLFTVFTRSSFNTSTELTLDIPSGAKYLCISTLNPSSAGYIDPVVEFI